MISLASTISAESVWSLEAVSWPLNVLHEINGPRKKMQIHEFMKYFEPIVVATSTGSSASVGTSSMTSRQILQAGVCQQLGVA